VISHVDITCSCNITCSYHLVISHVDITCSYHLVISHVDITCSYHLVISCHLFKFAASAILNSKYLRCRDVKI